MKTIFTLCGVVLVGGGIFLWYEFRTPMTYGVFTGASKLEVAKLIDHPQDFMHKTWALEGTIRDQCTTMGCFFFFYEGTKKLRVDLADIAMYAPKGRNGLPARVEGQIVPYGQDYQFSASAVEFK